MVENALGSPPQSQRVAAYQFVDQRGQNVVLFYQHPRPTGDTSDLFMVHAGIDRGVVHRFGGLTVRPDACEDDGGAGFLQPYLQLSDQDHDGISELRFAYSVQCTTDCSGPMVTAIVTEGGIEQVRVYGIAQNANQWPQFVSQLEITLHGLQGAERTRRERLALTFWQQMGMRYQACPGSP